MWNTWTTRTRSTLRWSAHVREACFFSFIHAQFLCTILAAQNLACGLFEVKPKAETAGPSDETEELQDLQLPSQQTAAVSAAKRAGRALVSEVGSDGDGDGDEAAPPVSTAAQRKKKKRRRA